MDTLDEMAVGIAGTGLRTILGTVYVIKEDVCAPLYR